MDKALEKPVISIVMPVFNCANFVAEAIESILNQTLAAFELIIIDDCSTDNTVQIINTYQDSRIRFVQKKTNTGLVDSLNMGMELSTGEYIARMDGDDISKSNRLEKQVSFLNQHPDIDLCGTAYELSGSQSIVSYPKDHEDIKIALLDYCPIGHPTVMIRKSFITKNNLQYLNSFEGAEDYELWTRCIWLGKLANIPDVLLFYRLHNHQFSNTNKHNQVKNSDACRVNMLLKVYPEASLNDTYTREIFFQKENFQTPAKLNDMLTWMDNLIVLNQQKACYDQSKFKNYISIKKLNTIRRFFLNQTAYTPAVLLNFIKHQKKYKNSFSIAENVKLVIKCFLFWKLKPVNS